LKLSKALEPHFKNWNLSLLRLNSIISFYLAASAVPNTSACTEWSMTRSTGQRGLILEGSPPRRCMQSLMAARSTTAGTPVKSWRMTLAGLKGMSTSFYEFLTQSNILSTSPDCTLYSSQFLTADSSSTRIEYGRDSIRWSFREGSL